MHIVSVCLDLALYVGAILQSAILQIMCYNTNDTILQIMCNITNDARALDCDAKYAMCLQRSRCLFTVLCDAALNTRLHISGVGIAVLIAILCDARYCAELIAR